MLYRLIYDENIATMKLILGLNGEISEQGKFKLEDVLLQYLNSQYQGILML